MNDKPTFKDYYFHRERNYIRSNDQYFVMDEKKTSLIFWIGLGILIALLIASIILDFIGIIWSGIYYDILFVLYLIPVIMPIIKYRRTKFTLLQMDTEERKKASELSFSPGSSISSILWLILIAAFIFPSGFTVSFIRSQLDGGGIIEVRVKGEETYYDDTLTFDESAPIPITVPPDENVKVYISILHTPQTARLSLNGNTQPPDIYQPNKRQINFTDYFRQDGICKLPDGAYRDGSTLTLTCGDLTREWVFDTADKEGA